MELFEVASNKRKSVIQQVLSHLVSGEEKDEIIDNLNLCFKEGGELFAFESDNEPLGLFMASKYSDDGTNIDELVLDEFYFIQDKMNTENTNLLASEIKKLNKTYRPTKYEVVVTREISWLGSALAKTGFMAEMLKLEKILPKPKYLMDVLELIDDSIPKDKIANEKILQVLLQKDLEYETAIIEDEDEIDTFLSEGWEPIMVIVSFEPRDQQIQDVINQSNQLINWDDFEIIYTI